jgi:hypothetical protein
MSDWGQVRRQGQHQLLAEGRRTNRQSGSGRGCRHPSGGRAPATRGDLDRRASQQVGPSSRRGSLLPERGSLVRRKLRGNDPRLRPATHGLQLRTRGHDQVAVVGGHSRHRGNGALLGSRLRSSSARSQPEAQNGIGRSGGRGSPSFSGSSSAPFSRASPTGACTRRTTPGAPIHRRRSWPWSWPASARPSSATEQLRAHRDRSTLLARSSRRATLRIAPNAPRLR